MATQKQKRIASFFIICLLMAITLVLVSKFGVLPCWVVWGHIVDKQNNPISHASVTAHLGIGSESSVLTKDDGAFCLFVTLPAWSVSKGGKPSISVAKDGYKEYWMYYKPWSWGLKIKKASIILAKNGDDLNQSGR